MKNVRFKIFFEGPQMHNNDDDDTKIVFSVVEKNKVKRAHDEFAKKLFRKIMIKKKCNRHCLQYCWDRYWELKTYMEIDEYDNDDDEQDTQFRRNSIRNVQQSKNVTSQTGILQTRVNALQSPLILCRLE